MTWTDGAGVTHEVVTYVSEYGDVSIVTAHTDRRYVSLSRGAWMRCAIRAPPGSGDSLRAVDCMTCLVKGFA
jgi:hypothetical protein